MKPEEVIAEVKKSGLRGKGGGGFVTANKWEKARKPQLMTKVPVISWSMAMKATPLHTWTAA
ncbi:MAG: hypothetical protein Ct9H300mP23_07140 [Nitrospinota bacterium]|nr:MAG: hypothetical protein Ct9H300mP23_07140 [Nitrospinota bacterium]